MIQDILLCIKTLGGIYHWEKICECPLCGGVEFRPHSKHWKGLFTIRLQSCAACGLIIQNPRLSADSLDSFYRSGYRPGSKNNKGCEKLFDRGVRRGTYICDFLRENGIDYKGSVIFEVGCSYGGILEQFKREGCSVKGCDLDGMPVRYGVSKGLDLEEGSIDTLKKSGCKADIVVLSHVLEHIPDPILFIKGVKSLLNPGGILYIEAPGMKNGKSKRRYIQPGHLLYFDLRTLRRVVEKTNFRFISGNEKIQSIFAT